MQPVVWLSVCVISPQRSERPEKGDVGGGERQLLN